MLLAIGLTDASTAGTFSIMFALLIYYVGRELERTLNDDDRF